MKILYVTTISNTVNAFLIPHIKMLIDSGHQVDVAFNIDQDVDPEILNMGCKVHNIPLQRKPLNRYNIISYLKMKNLIISESYDIVHTHTPVASAIIRIVCKNILNLKVIYTAHGFHFYKGAPFINWLVYYPIEKWLSRYTDVLITINKEDYANAESKLNSKRVELIPGVGIEVAKYQNLIVDKTIFRRELGVPDDSFIILSVGELNNNKNHEIIIKAINKISDKNIHFVICGAGENGDYLKNLATALNLKNNVHLVGYRNDIPEICKSSDVFAFPSKREGLGLAAIEAMAAGLPIVTSNIHGIIDYSVNEITGYLCNPTNEDEFADSIIMLYQSESLRSEYGENNLKIAKRYDLNNILNKLYGIYRSII